MEMSIEPEVDKIGICLQQASLKYFPVIFAIRLLIMVQIRRNTLNNTTRFGAESRFVGIGGRT